MDASTPTHYWNSLSRSQNVDQLLYAHDLYAQSEDSLYRMASGWLNLYAAGKSAGITADDLYVAGRTEIQQIAESEPKFIYHERDESLRLRALTAYALSETIAWPLTPYPPEQRQAIYENLLQVADQAIKQLETHAPNSRRWDELVGFLAELDVLLLNWRPDPDTANINAIPTAPFGDRKSNRRAIFNSDLHMYIPGIREIKHINCQVKTTVQNQHRKKYARSTAIIGANKHFEGPGTGKEKTIAVANAALHEHERGADLSPQETEILKGSSINVHTVFTDKLMELYRKTGMQALAAARVNSFTPPMQRMQSDE